MAFPVYTYANSNTATAGTTHSITLPSGVSQGDLLLGFFSAGSSVTTITSTWPGGWTKIYEAASTTFILSTAYKFAGASEAGFNITTNANSYSATRLFDIKRAHASTAPVQGTEVVSVGTSPNPPAVNPAAWDVEDTLWIAVAAIANQSGTSSAAPSNYSDLLAHNSGGGSSAGAALVSAYRNNSVASEDPGSFTTSPNTSYRTNTVSVRPAIASGSPRFGDFFHI